MVKELGDICLGFIQNNLSSIPQLCSNLPTLYKERLLERLAYHDMLHKDYLPHVSYNLMCSALRHIKLYKCHQVDDHFLTLLAASKCEIEVLVIHGCTAVTDAGVKEITAGQEKLCVLELKKLPRLTSLGLAAIHSPALWKVEMKKCPLITCEGVTALANECQGIKVLRIAHCPTLERRTYGCVAAALGDVLEELDLGIPGVTDEELVQLSRHCSNLKKLNLTGAKAVGKEALIKLFQGCTRLQSLDLSYCSRLAKNSECQALWTLPQTLKELSLCGIQLEDQQVFVEALQRLRSLTSLRLCGVSALNDTTLRKILEHVGSNLETLDISGGFTKTLTDEGLRAITKHCRQLQEMCLSLLTQVTGVTLSPIFQDPKRANNFRKLYLSCRELDVSVLSQVSLCCHELTLLEISGITAATDDLLFQLADNCPKLTHLGIKGCRQITDRAVCELVRQCPIKSLVLSGIHGLTDKCIFALANSRPELEEIYLNGCAQITPAAVRYLCDCCITRLFANHAIPNAVPNQLMAKNLDTGEFCRADLMPVNMNNSDATDPHS
ncbi:F-box/LRR-repeat protein 2-like [Littorina saxatilis]|uniref:F-box/LRR-repeat protein 15-like leucin rich repeat domain-containing protein n=1 Tax=Littorina saxatilis TaxID=31220 RepID=A0AAN9GJH7_9CAEN